LKAQIADRREFYNDAINVFNTRIQEMPDTIVCAYAGNEAALMFQVSAAEKSPARLVLNTRSLNYRKNDFCKSRILA